MKKSKDKKMARGVIKYFKDLLDVDDETLYDIFKNLKENDKK